MRLLCSHCHTVFDQKPDEPHKACPNCKAEAGLEPVSPETPNPMKLFGTILMILAVSVVGGSVVSLLP